MLNLITIKDPHFSYGFRNIIRKNYERDMDNKLEFISNFVKENNCDILFTGDICDKITKKWSFTQYGINKRKLLKLKGDKKIYSNVGNHDQDNGLEIGSDDITIQEKVTTVFNELCIDNIINNITKNNLITEEAIIYGVDYNSDPKYLLNKIEEFNSIKTVKCKIIVLHCNVTPEGQGKALFTYEQLTEDFRDIDVFVNGHYHIGYPTCIKPRVNGKNAYFINNWNLNRVMRDYDVTLNKHSVNMTHLQIGGIDPNSQVNQHIINFQDIEIPHLNYEEAFEMKNIDLLKKTKDEVYEFFENVKFDDLSTFRKSDNELLENLKTKNSEINEKVLSKVKDYLGI